MEIKLPKNYSKETREYIRDTIKELEQKKILNEFDRHNLLIMAQLYEICKRVGEEVMNEGFEIVNARGAKDMNPKVRVHMQYYDRLNKLQSQYGLTAKSRKQMQVADTEEVNPFEEFINK